MHIQAGQITATSKDLAPQKVAEEGKSVNPIISVKSRLVKYYF